MFKNDFKTAWRNIQRNRVNSFINIVGLAIGMSYVVLIAMYVQDEKSYNTFFRDAKNLYQVNMTGTDKVLLTVSYQSVRAALSKPVKSLRWE